jgi:hypothetical protein
VRVERGCVSESGEGRRSSFGGGVHECQVLIATTRRDANCSQSACQAMYHDDSGAVIKKIVTPALGYTHSYQ